MTVKLYIIFLALLLFTSCALAQNSSVNGIFELQSKDHQIKLFIAEKDSISFPFWVTIDSLYYMGGTFSLFENDNNKFYFFSAGKNDRQNSTCVLEILNKGNLITLLYYDTICFGYKFRGEQLDLKKKSAKVDNDILINQIFKKRDTYRLLTDDVIYEKSETEYIATKHTVGKGQIIISHYKDNLYRIFYYLNKDGHLVEGWIKDSDVVPMN